MSQDYNVLQTNKFIFSLQRIPETMFRVTGCSLPSINIPPPSEDSTSANQYFAGSSVEFDPITLTFIVDENLKNYKEIFDWMTAEQFNDSHEVRNEAGLYTDGTLTTLTNASNPNVVFRFAGMFPISLGELQFDTTNTTSTVLCTVTFRYSYFKYV
jgi:hypothetical protein